MLTPCRANFVPAPDSKPPAGWWPPAQACAALNGAHSSTVATRRPEPIYAAVVDEFMTLA
jgi:hypothetical protein